MRVAIACAYDYSHPGGVQTHISALARQLVDKGQDVKILAPCGTGSPFESVPGVETIGFGRSVPWPSAGSVARISFSVWHERKLKSLLTERNFDILHVHEPLMPFFALTSVYASSIPTVGTFHAYNEGVGKGYVMWRPVLERIAKRLSGRIAVSEPARQYAMRYFPGDYTIVPNGVDVERFSAPTERPTVFRKGDTNIVFVGRMSEPRKGLKYLLDAYSILKLARRQVRLIVVGPGVPTAESYRLMSERCLDDVVFAGRLMPDELPAFYQHADIFCAPNTGNESFGLVVGEGLAAGTAVVASDIQGFRSVLTNEKDALLVPPKDPLAIARAIKRLMDEPGLRERLSSAGRVSVERFRWSKVADRLLDFYNKVLSNTPSSGSVNKEGP